MKKRAGKDSLQSKLVAALVLIVLLILAWSYWKTIQEKPVEAATPGEPIVTLEPTIQPTLPPQPTKRPSPTPEITPTPLPVVVHRIEINDFYYKPDSLTIKAGDVVVWRNNGGALHTVTGKDKQPPGLASPWLDYGKEFNYTFATPGTYPYYDSVHGGVNGVIIVE